MSLSAGIPLGTRSGLDAAQGVLTDINASNLYTPGFQRFAKMFTVVRHMLGTLLATLVIKHKVWSFQACQASSSV